MMERKNVMLRPVDLRRLDLLGPHWERELRLAQGPCEHTGRSATVRRCITLAWEASGLTEDHPTMQQEERS